MATDIASLNPVLKETYLGPIRDLLNNKTVLLKRVQRNTEDVEGRFAVIPIRIGRNEGIGARPESGDLPTAGQQSYDRATFSLKYNYGRIQVTGPAAALATSDEGAFLRAFESEMEGVINDLLHDLNRQVFGNGDGLLAPATGTTTGSNKVVTFPNAEAIKFARKGVKCDVVDSANNHLPVANGTNVEITAVDRTALTVTFTNAAGNLGAASGTIGLTRTGAITGGTSAISHEMMGIQGIVSDSNPPTLAGNLGGIDRTSVEEWQSNRLHNSGTLRPLSLDLLEEGFDKVDIKGDGEITLGTMPHPVYRGYSRLLLPDRRYQSTGESFTRLDGGFDALLYNDVPFVKDKDAPANKIFLLAEDTLIMFENGDFDWMDKDGAVLSRVPNKDAYEAVIFRYATMGSSDPRDNLVIEDVDA